MAARNARLSGSWNDKNTKAMREYKFLRPTDWPSLPSVTAGQHKVVGLFGLVSNGYNDIDTIRLTISTGGTPGTCVIDWGDTTTTTISSVVSNTVYSHDYTYSSFSATVTSEGFKPAIVTVTASGGMTLTVCNMASSVDAASTTRYNNLLECAFAGANITAHPHANSSSSIKSYVQVGDNSISSGSIGLSCQNLQKIDGVWSTSNTTGSFSSAFNSCFALKELSMTKYSATATTASTSSMFSLCLSLREIPLFNASLGTTCVSMFANSSIETMPAFTFSGDCSTMTTGAYAMKRFASGVAFSNITTSLGLTNLYSLTSFPELTISTSGTPTINIECYNSIGNLTISGSGTLTLSGNFRSLGTLTRSGGAAMGVTLSSTRLSSIGTVTGATGWTVSGTLNSIERYPSNTLGLTAVGATLFQNNSVLRVPPIFTVSSGTVDNIFTGCSSILYIPAINLSAATSYTTWIGTPGTENAGLRKIDATGIAQTFSIASANLEQPALDTLYTNLASVTAKTITVTGNPGTATDDPTIATAKGWTVTG